MASQQVERDTEPGRGQAHLPPVGALVAGILVVAVIALAAFAWPAARLAPRELPVAVAGPGAARVEAALAERGDAFEVHRVTDEAAARGAIKQREVYGAIIATPEELHILTAPAASNAVAQLLTQFGTTAVAAQPQGSARQSLRITPIVRPAAGDPLGTLIAAAVLPLVLVGMATGILLTLLVASAWRRAAAVISVAVLSGFAAVLLVQGWLDGLDGNWVLNGSVLSLTLLAIAAGVAGPAAILGRAGLAIGAPLMIFVANPFAGATSAPELLPEPAGLIGQLLPPGAGANLLKSTAFFDSAAAGSHVTVLTTWAVAGLILLFAAGLRQRRHAALAAPQR